MKRILLWTAVGFAAIALIVILKDLLLTIKFNSASDEVVVVEDTTVFIPTPPKIAYGVSVDSLEIEQGTIKRNENLGEILSRYNVPAQKIAELGNIPREQFNVRKIVARKPYTILHKKDSLKTAEYFVYHPNPIDYVVVGFEDSVKVTLGKNKVDTLTETFAGQIESSLYMTVVEQGGTPVLVNELADVFAWVIDFFGIQKGDQFKVMYTRYVVNGEDAGFGEITGAWFMNEGREFYAIKYDQGEGREFFDLEGASLRKTFLKAPLKFNRISSRFSHSRFHPVLKIRRPHRGVDYAAPTGTPVVSVGDGVVTMRDWSGGGGNTIKVKHNGNYTTGYMHLSRYAKGLKKGDYVKQGQVIGYVGTTGLSTGPHLDFRFWKNGVAVDPLKIDPPSANPIKEELMVPYMEEMKRMQAKLDAIRIGTGEIVTEAK